MYINQISVFVENKPGNLANFTNFLADNNIDIRAFEIADSSDYGIVCQKVCKICKISRFIFYEN